MPKYLAEADLPGTYGFDPLRLGTNPDNLKWCGVCCWRCAAGMQAMLHTSSVTTCLTDIYLALSGTPRQRRPTGGGPWPRALASCSRTRWACPTGSTPALR